MRKCVTCYPHHCNNEVATNKDVYCEACKRQHVLDEEIRRAERAAMRATLDAELAAVEAKRKAIRSVWDECLRRGM